MSPRPKNFRKVSGVPSVGGFIPLCGGIQDAENGAYPPTQNGLIHPQLLLKWP